MIGLTRGKAELHAHETEWEREAERTIIRLKEILGSAAKDIQHVGSTAVPAIKAKPIIDIAVAVDDFGDVLAKSSALADAGFYYRPEAGSETQLLFACGSFYDGTGDMQTHFIHVVRFGSMEWVNYINFRDYLCKTPSAREAYEDLKLSLVQTVQSREAYTAGKHDFITYTLRKALVDSYLGKTIDIFIDRPIGYVHQKEQHIITYSVNYGYIPGVLGGDGEELDVYLLGVSVPVRDYRAKVIGIVHRRDDVEDKLIAAPENMLFTKVEMETEVHFAEQYYDSYIEVLENRVV